MQYDLNFKNYDGTVISTASLYIPDEPGRYNIPSDFISSSDVVVNSDVNSEIVVNKAENRYELTFYYRPNIYARGYFTTNAVENYTEYAITRPFFALPVSGSFTDYYVEDRDILGNQDELSAKFSNSMAIEEYYVGDLSVNDYSNYSDVFLEARDFMSDKVFIYSLGLDPNDIVQMAADTGFLDDGDTPMIFIINKNVSSIFDSYSLNPEYFDREVNGYNCYYWDVFKDFNVYNFFPTSFSLTDVFQYPDISNPLKFVYFSFTDFPGSTLLYDEIYYYILNLFEGIPEDNVKSIPIEMNSSDDPTQALQLLVDTFDRMRQEYDNQTDNVLLIIPGSYLGMLCQALEPGAIDPNNWLVLSIDAPPAVMDNILYGNDDIISRLNFPFYYTYPYVNYDSFDLVLSNILTKVNEGESPDCNLKVVEFAPWIEIIPI